MNEPLDYDILIVGGGMVGASLAVALGGQNCRVAVIESVPLRSSDQPSYNDRSIALAYGSKKIFSTIGLWQHLQSHVAPIHKIHISDRGHFGATRLDCKDEDVDALGYVVETRALGKVLQERLAESKNIDLLCPAELESLAVTDQCVTVKAREQCNESSENSTARTITASLLVAADGSQSLIRE